MAAHGYHSPLQERQQVTNENQHKLRHGEQRERQHRGMKPYSAEWKLEKTMKSQKRTGMTFQMASPHHG